MRGKSKPSAEIEIIILETGLGGRLDATNAVQSNVSVITSIALDHQKWLGATLESIAFEKAGIIKPEIPVITATADPEALALIESTAKANMAALTLVTDADLDQQPVVQPGKKCWPSRRLVKC